MIDSTNPRIMADNIRALSGEAGSQASDISELQETVEAIGTYSTNEIDTGKKWIDNSPIYRKAFEIASLPNNTQLYFEHGISNLDKIIRAEGMSQISTNQTARPLPFSTSILFSISATLVYIITTSDYSGQGAILYIEYTKSAAPSALTSPAPDDSRSIEPEFREEAPEEEPIIEEEPVVEVKKTTRKKTTTTE